MNIYGFAPISGACHWYRIREPLRALANLGHMTEFGEVFEDGIVNRNDTILTHILHDEQGSLAWQWLAQENQHRLIFDIDDNIWKYPEGTQHHEFWTPERLQRVEANMRLSHLITTPSHVLADFLAFGLSFDPARIVVLPNYIPEWVTEVQAKLPDHFTVGYQGAPQKLHQADLDTIQVELFHFLHKCPDARLLFFGQPHNLEGAGQFADRVEFIPWTPVVPDYYRSLHRMTVGIAPLAANPFTDCKSAVRAVEYHALGIPALYSSRPAYRGWVEHRDTGYLLNNAGDWRRQLIKLYHSPATVQTLSRKAWQLGQHWTIEGNIWQWEQAYNRVGPYVSNPPVVS
jgi:hypothetical protein